MSHQFKISKEEIAKILDSSESQSESESAQLPGVHHPRPPAGALSIDLPKGPRHPDQFARELSEGPITVRKIAIRPDNDGGMILDLE